VGFHWRQVAGGASARVAARLDTPTRGHLPELGRHLRARVDDPVEQTAGPARWWTAEWHGEPGRQFIRINIVTSAAILERILTGIVTGSPTGQCAGRRSTSSFDGMPVSFWRPLASKAAGPSRMPKSLSLAAAMVDGSRRRHPRSWSARSAPRPSGRAAATWPAGDAGLGWLLHARGVRRAIQLAARPWLRLLQRSTSRIRPAVKPSGDHVC
jgi:hypothetical protein